MPTYVTRRADGGDGEIDGALVVREGSDFNAVNALIEAVESGFEGAIWGFRYVHDEMKDSSARLKRAGPVPLQGFWLGSGG